MYDLKELILEANNVETSAERLETLYHCDERSVRKAVAGNPSTPSKVLLKLSIEFPLEFWGNPVVDLWLFEDDNPFRLYEAYHLLYSKWTTPKYLEFIWSLRNEETEWMFAITLLSNFTCPIDVLKEIKEMVEEAGRSKPSFYDNLKYKLESHIKYIW